MNRTRFKDYAILYRGNHQSRIFEKALMTNRIPLPYLGWHIVFSRTEIKDIMAYLKLLVNPDEDTAFLRVVNLPRREIGPTTLENWASTPTSVARACLPPVSSWGWSNTSPDAVYPLCRPSPTGW